VEFLFEGWINGRGLGFQFRAPEQQDFLIQMSFLYMSVGAYVFLTDPRETSVNHHGTKERHGQGKHRNYAGFRPQHCEEIHHKLEAPIAACGQDSQNRNAQNKTQEHAQYFHGILHFLLTREPYACDMHDDRRYTALGLPLKATVC
jgi:hypothetical protein